VFLLIAVINNEEILDELMTGWLDIGITEATVAETTDLVQLISTHVPIFAGFRSLTTGGMPHNRTVFAAVEKQEVLDQAVRFLEVLCEKIKKTHQGAYFVVPMLHYGRLGLYDQ
jgi:nitrogen regulatory protein P-II 1